MAAINIACHILNHLLCTFMIYPICTRTEVEPRSKRRDTLRLLCLLLPKPNRDTLKCLLHFLNQVALHSNDIIMMDGTEEQGNKMSEENLGMIMGPNILHKVRVVFGVVECEWLGLSQWVQHIRTYTYICGLQAITTLLSILLAAENSRAVGLRWLPKG